LSKNSSFSSEISQRYALALYDLSIENNSTEEFASNMSSFLNIFNSNENLKNFVKNPTNSMEIQKKVFEKISDVMKFNNTVKNFFLILVIKKRVFLLESILKKFLSIISVKKGHVLGNLISSRKIEEKTLDDIEKDISLSIGKKIKLNYKIDESLIGGVVIQIGSLMIDTSIKNKLQKLKKSMIEA
tara:strand:- start:633 stop:1190 length:558 start_codon:yes stop_codon:yes gene_type:complete